VAKDESDPTPYTSDKIKLTQIPGLTSDDDTYQDVSAALHGGKALNWEDKTFQYMTEEKDKLQPQTMNDLAGSWKTDGNNLKTESENFKKLVQQHIAGSWEGESAEAADAATGQVTKTSIYDFTPVSDEISNRLQLLGEAFTKVQSHWPGGDGLFKDGNFNLAGLNNEIGSFNERYHLDGSGRLRNNSDGYVAASTAYDQMQELRRSVTAYQEAVRRFRVYYNGAILSVTDGLPVLPDAPDMTYGKPPGDPSGPGTGPGTGPGAGPGSGPGMPAIPNAGMPNTDGIKPFDPKALDPKLPDTKLPDSDLPNAQTTDPATSAGQDGLSGLTSPLTSAMDAAKDAIGQATDAAKGMGQGLQDPNLGGPQGPPEGVLGLGPQGLGGGAAGAGAGGSGGGAAMPKSLAMGKTVEAPATAAAKAPAAAAGTGAGLANGSGSPGAGAPAAGQRGGDQSGKGHQVNKALRRKKNGRDVIGDAEGTVAVVGAADGGEQPEELHVDDASHTPDKPGEPNQKGGPAPRRIPRPKLPLQVPGQ
jgi:hypothetical protein